MATVLFSRSGISGEFSAADESILELGERLGVALDFSCRKGNCTVCQQPVSGEVRYPFGHNGEPEPGNALICCSVPDGDVVVEA